MPQNQKCHKIEMPHNQKCHKIKMPQNKVLFEKCTPVNGYKLLPVWHGQLIIGVILFNVDIKEFIFKGKIIVFLHT